MVGVFVFVGCFFFLSLSFLSIEGMTLVPIAVLLLHILCLMCACVDDLVCIHNLSFKLSHMAKIGLNKFLYFIIDRATCDNEYRPMPLNVGKIITSLRLRLI